MPPTLGPLSAHMAQHILLMNLLAPVLALALWRLRPALRPGHLVLAAVMQIVLLWAWHAPPVLPAVLAVPVLHLAMQLSLLGIALWFWMAVVAISGTASWRPILALLVTSKLFCLLGVLLVFSPRFLYGTAPLHHGHLMPGLDQLADQHLAGLLMLVACPASYVLAGVIIAARWFTALKHEAGAVRSGLDA